MGTSSAGLTSTCMRIWDRGYTPMAEETLDAANQSEGDTKEGMYFGREVPLDSPEAAKPLTGPNQWPSPVRPCSARKALPNILPAAWLPCACRTSPILLMAVEVPGA